MGHNNSMRQQIRDLQQELHDFKIRHETALDQAKNRIDMLKFTTQVLNDIVYTDREIINTDYKMRMILQHNSNIYRNVAKNGMLFMKQIRHSPGITDKFVRLVEMYTFAARKERKDDFYRISGEIPVKIDFIL